MTDEPEIIPESEDAPSDEPLETPDSPEADSDVSPDTVDAMPDADADESDEALDDAEPGIHVPPDDDVALPGEDLVVDRRMADLIALETDGLNVDEALAAVASLSDLVHEPDDLAIAPDSDETDDLFGTGTFDEAATPTPQPVAYLSAPPMLTLQRGQMASVIPALLLIAIGGWLVFSLTTSETSPSAPLVIGLLGGGIGLALIAQWLSADRWAQGSLFAGTALLLCGGVFLWLTNASDPGLVQGWPLLVVAGGAAFILAAFLSPASAHGQTAIGLLIAAAGLVGYVVTAGLIDSALVNTIGGLWPVVLVALLILWGLPVIFRGRR